MGIFKRIFSQKKKETTFFCVAVVVAAGTASRMEGVDKILCSLGNEPILLNALRPFEQSQMVDEIIIVTREDLMVDIGTMCSEHEITKVRRVVKGGDSRVESVLAGVREVGSYATHIAIHDGARPFVTVEVIEEAIEKAYVCSAAAPAIPVKDTIKRAVDGVVFETPNRAELFAVQTPQVFASDLIRAALTKALEDGASLTDDCSAVERLGFPVHLTRGSEENIKITTPPDLLHGEAILAERSGL